MSAGDLVPDFEVLGKGPGTTELRFVKTEDEVAAKEILVLASKAGIPMEGRDMTRTHSNSTATAARTLRDLVWRWIRSIGPRGTTANDPL